MRIRFGRHHGSSLGWSLVTLPALLVLGCGAGESNSVVNDAIPGDAAGSSSTQENTASGAAGSVANESAPSGGMTGPGPAGAGSTSPSSGGSSAGGAASASMGDDAGMCPASSTEAMRIDLEVTWPATLAGNAGSGTISIWNRSRLTFADGAVTGSNQPCGLVLPDATYSAIGQAVTGGERLLLEVPEPSWDAPAFPTFPISGISAGSMGSISFGWSSLVGVVLDDPASVWPDSGAALVTNDPESDSNPGITTLPRQESPYVLPPTSIGLGGTAPAADEVYTVSRNILAVEGVRSSCEAHGGAIVVTAYDNHVVGCHIAGGADCNADQSDFLDQNRTIYSPVSATYQSVRIDDASTCADVRAALPL